MASTIAQGIVPNMMSARLAGKSSIAKAYGMMQKTLNYMIQSQAAKLFPYQEETLKKMIVKDFCEKTGIPESHVVSFAECEDSTMRTASVTVSFVHNESATFDCTTGPNGREYAPMTKRDAVIADKHRIFDPNHERFRFAYHEWKDVKGIRTCVHCKEFQGFHNKVVKCEEVMRKITDHIEEKAQKAQRDLKRKQDEYDLIEKDDKKSFKELYGIDDPRLPVDPRIPTVPGVVTPDEYRQRQVQSQVDKFKREYQTSPTKISPEMVVDGNLSVEQMVKVQIRLQEEMRSNIDRHASSAIVGPQKPPSPPPIAYTSEWLAGPFTVEHDKRKDAEVKDERPDKDGKKDSDEGDKQ